MSNDNLPNLKAIRKQCQDFAKLHLTACCAELLEWQDTAILCDGRVRELAALCNTFVSNHDGLRVAESFINRAAVEAQRDAVAASGAGVPVAMTQELYDLLMAWAIYNVKRGYTSDTKMEAERALLSHIGKLTAAPTPDRATKAEAAPAQGELGDAARLAKFQERMRLFQIGKCLEDEEIDDQQQYRIGAELIALSGICTSCYGGGQDGDAPDANGEGGWVGLCGQCDGTGLAAIQAQAGEGGSREN